MMHSLSTVVPTEIGGNWYRSWPFCYMMFELCKFGPRVNLRQNASLVCLPGPSRSRHGRRHADGVLGTRFNRRRVRRCRGEDVSTVPGAGVEGWGPPESAGRGRPASSGRARRSIGPVHNPHVSQERNIDQGRVLSAGATAKSRWAEETVAPGETAIVSMPVMRRWCHGE